MARLVTVGSGQPPRYAIGRGFNRAAHLARLVTAGKEKIMVKPGHKFQ